MRLSNILLLYRVRLRTRAVQELFAVLGIAVGVALLFASQVASTSLDGSVNQLTRGIVGNMRFQLAARGPAGFDERLLGEVQRIPAVRAAVPLLEARANVIGPKGTRAVDLLGTDPRFAHLGGPLLRHFTAAQLNEQEAFALPLPVAQAVGLTSLELTKLQIGAKVVQAFLGTALLGSDIGALVESPVAIAPLAYAQHLTGMPGRVTRIFVQAAPGREREVKAGLERISAGHLNVRPADFDSTLFRQAAGPANQSAVLFSAISALIGFLFAFNAILLTVPQRRHLVEDLRLDGYARRAIVQVLLLDALVLGLVASVLGLALGDLLSLAVFHTNPGYLSFAFPVGSQRIITVGTVAIAMGGGMLAACIGVLLPLRGDVFSRLSLAAPIARSNPLGAAGASAAGICCLAVTTVILLAAPQWAIIGMIFLVVALLLLLPALLGSIVRGFDRIHRPIRGAAADLAGIELGSKVGRARSLAIAATGAIAVFGSVAIEGAHRNLERGLSQASAEVNFVADLWLSPSGSASTLATIPFHNDRWERLKRLPSVRALMVYRGSFLDIGDHRTLVVAPSRESADPIPLSQVVSGDPKQASTRIREHGWLTVSRAIADEYHLSPGQRFELLAPRATMFRVAAVTTNLGWPPGAIILNADDYAHAWSSSDPSAYQIDLKQGVSLAAGAAEVRRALGSQSGLAVQTALQRQQAGRATQRQGLSRLTQIATLVLVAAILAMAAAMGAMIWHRRPRLADMKVDGFSNGVLWRAMLVETTLLLGMGCSVGALFGIYGAILLSHALASVTGFPVVFSLGVPTAISSFLIVTAVAVAIVAIPGYIAARIRPAIILQD